MRFVAITKADKSKPPPSAKDESVGIHRASDDQGPKVVAEIMSSVEQVASEITPELVERLLNLGALDRIVDHEIDWRFLELLLQQKVKPELIQAVKAAADNASRFTAATLKDELGIVPDLTFDARSPRLLRWIDGATGQLIVDATAETRDAVKDVVARVMSSDMDPAEAFSAIRRSIGLTRIMAGAAQGVYETGVNEGLDHEEAMREADDYAQRALTQRANTIARTETMRAANQGQAEGWEQAADQGYFNREDAEVEWVTAHDDRLCPTCAAMDGVRRPVDGVWTVEILDAKGRSRGTVQIDNPSAVHPNCRCTQRLIVGGG